MNRNGVAAVLVLITLSFSAPLLVSADGYGGPFCYEPKSLTTSTDPELLDPTGIRGTCKKIHISDVVSLDPALQKDYFIGTHYPIAECDGPPCTTFSKFSETLTIYSSSTVVIFPADFSSQPDYVPVEVAAFDKSFFWPLFSDQFQKNQLNFSESNFPPININIYDQNEMKNAGALIMPYPPTSTDMLHVDSGGGYFSSAYYSLDTFSTTEYGKHIWAPKGDLVESQYAGLYKNSKAPTSKDLGISYVFDHNAYTPTVSVVDPLTSITNYWTYSLVNGKVSLVWQKTNYAMDDGFVKTTASSSNGNAVSIPVSITATLTTTTSPNTVSTTTAIATTTSQNQVNHTPQSSTPAEENIFQKFWNFILSLFK